MRRRAILASVGVSAGALSGCLGGMNVGSPDRETEPPEWCPDPDDDPEYRCGEAGPIETTGEIDDEELDRSFGGRLGLACHDVGAQRALNYTSARLDHLSGLEMGKGGPGEEIGAVFRVYTGDAEDGPEDPVSMEEVLAVAPVFVDTTIRHDDEEHTCAVPVFVGTYDHVLTDD